MNYADNDNYSFVMALVMIPLMKTCLKQLKNLVTIKIGQKRSMAEYYFNTVEEARNLLDNLLQNVLTKMLDKLIHIVPIHPYSK